MLEHEDYNEFVKLLQPEMDEAKLSVTGKPIATISKLMDKYERNAPMTTLPNGNAHAADTAILER